MPDMSDGSGSSQEVSAAAAQEQVTRILASRHFAKAERLRRFLEFVVQETLRGLAPEIKETVIGVEVFGRPAATYDPRMDPIVRVQAGRVRAKLEAYYAEEGSDDRVLIELPRGQYVPRFGLRLAAPRQAGAAASTGPAVWQTNTIAVLPFVNLSADPADEYFSDGLTEELAHALARVPSLRVTARRSAFRFKGQNHDVRQIGRTLGAGKIVEGSVRKLGDRLRIIVQLVNAADGYEVWSGSYDRTVGDVFALQAEVAEAVRTALKGRVPERRGPNTDGRTTPVDALTYYLWGRFHWNKRSEAGLRAGIAHFGDAARVDPGFARAYSGLADCYIMLAMSGAERPRAVMPLARDAAMRAAELDHQLVEAHTSLAVVRANFDWDRGAAEDAFQQALECDATYATLHHWYGLYSLAPEHRFDEAEDEIEWAARLDPVSLPINLGHAQVFLLANNCRAAVAQCNKVLALDPSYYRAHWFLGIAHDRLGNSAAAIEALETARTKGAGERAFQARILGALGHAYAAAGQGDRASAILAEMTGLSSTSYVDPFEIAQIHAGLGDTEAALADLEAAAAERSGYLVFSGCWPAFEELRPLPRFQALLETMGLKGDADGSAG